METRYVLFEVRTDFFKHHLNTFRASQGLFWLQQLYRFTVYNHPIISQRTPHDLGGFYSVDKQGIYTLCNGSLIWKHNLLWLYESYQSSRPSSGQAGRRLSCFGRSVTPQLPSDVQRLPGHSPTRSRAPVLP
jgi:hypothetical protein